ncbi:MAG: hypothetical protein RLZZ271_903, partial [Pseudomonadota bacterium]
LRSSDYNVGGSNSGGGSNGNLLGGNNGGGTGNGSNRNGGSGSSSNPNAVFNSSYGSRQDSQLQNNAFNGAQNPEQGQEGSNDQNPNQGGTSQGQGAPATTGLNDALDEMQLDVADVQLLALGLVAGAARPCILWNAPESDLPGQERAPVKRKAKTSRGAATVLWGSPKNF